MRRILTGIIRFIARSLAALFATLFVPVAVLILLILNLDHTLLNAEVYKRGLSESGVYEQLPVLVGEQFSELESFMTDPCAEMPLACRIDGASPELQACLTDVLGEDAYVDIGSARRKPTEAELAASQPCLDQFPVAASESGPEAGSTDEEQAAARPPSFVDELDVGDWQALISYLLPPDDLRQMTETALDQVFAYLKGESETARIPLTGLKSRITGDGGEEFIRFLLSTQPACTDEQLAQIEAGNFGGDDQPTLMCDAQGEALEKLLPELQGQLDETVAKIPDEAILIKPPKAVEESGADPGPFGQDPLAAFRMIHNGMGFIPLVALGLLLLVALFGVRSFKGWLRWWGIPLLAAGLIALGLGLAALPALEWAWTNYALPKFPPMFSADIAAIGHDLARSVVRDFTLWTSLEAGLLTLLGLAALIGSYYLKPKVTPVPDK